MKDWNWHAILKRNLLLTVMTAAAALIICTVLGWMISMEWVPCSLAGAAAEILFGGYMLIAAWRIANKSKGGTMPAACLTVAYIMAVAVAAKLIFFSDAKLVFDWRWSIPVVCAVLAGLLAGRPKQYH